MQMQIINMPVAYISQDFFLFIMIIEAKITTNITKYAVLDPVRNPINTVEIKKRT